jgi:hypothetical protein
MVAVNADATSKYGWLGWLASEYTKTLFIRKSKLFSRNHGFFLIIPVDIAHKLSAPLIKTRLPSIF